ncbi:MAG: LysM peptidoglycan-binding domain-containing protein, partial [Gemmatimonadales bacterium]|nr:LysM peptidoglycan-binding domain-containing protein [Gemmatimonadales bacterium]
MPRKFSCTACRQLSLHRGLTLGWLAALTLAVSATEVLAQDSLPQTHTVRKGDTLWDLARLYHKDPFLWPGIFRLNTAVVEDPHWIYPGEVLRIAADATVAAVPTMDTPLPPQPADTTPLLEADSTETLARGPQQPSSAEAPAEEWTPLFPRQRARSAADILKSYTNQPYRPLRRSEFYSSGFLTENQRLPYGEVLGPVTPSQIKSIGRGASALPYTTVALAAPRGATYEVGDTLLIAQIGTEIEPYGRVVKPTGLAQVTEAVDGHYLASVVAVYGPIRKDQRVLPLESFSAASGERAVAVADGVRGTLLGGLGR